MDSDRLHDALTRAGLTAYQADAYLSLLEMGTAPVVDIAERSGVPASQAYDVVRRLEDRGFVETIERDRLHARAREPDEVLDELRGLGSLLSDAAGEIEDRWERPDQSSHRVSVVKRQETVVGRAEEAVAGATVSVEVATTAEQFEGLQPVLEDAADRGVVVRVAVYSPVDGLDVGDSEINEVREATAPGPFIAVVDRRTSFFSPNVHSEEPYGVLLDDEILSFILHWYFLTIAWTPYDQIYCADARKPEYVSIEEFVYETASTWYDGADVELTVIGHDTNTGDRVEVGGQLKQILVLDNTPPPRDPSYEMLGGQVTLVVDDGEELFTVGGWGAQAEDVEAEVIRVEDVRPAMSDSERPA